MDSNILTTTHSEVQSQLETIGQTQDATTIAPLYKVIEGLDGTGMSLSELLKKPFNLGTYTFNASTYQFSYNVQSDFYSKNPFAKMLAQLYLTYYFNVEFTIHISGHQFVIALFGAAFDPSYPNVTEAGLLTVPIPNVPYINEEWTKSLRYNTIANLDGVFQHLSDASTFIKVKAILPRNVTYNNIAFHEDTTRNEQLGTLHFFTISQPYFSMDTNKFDARLYATLTDVQPRPFNNRLANE